MILERPKPRQHHHVHAQRALVLATSRAETRLEMGALRRSFRGSTGGGARAIATVAKDSSGVAGAHDPLVAKGVVRSESFGPESSRQRGPLFRLGFRERLLLVPVREV